MDRIAILQCALEQRQQEIFYQQINLTNYRLALKKVEGLGYEQRFKLRKFVSDLESKVAQVEIEQLESIVMLEVLKEQIEEGEAPVAGLLDVTPS